MMYKEYTTERGVRVREWFAPIPGRKRGSMCVKEEVLHPNGERHCDVHGKHALLIFNPLSKEWVVNFFTHGPTPTSDAWRYPTHEEAEKKYIELRRSILWEEEA